MRSNTAQTALFGANRQGASARRRPLLQLSRTPSEIPNKSISKVLTGPHSTAGQPTSGSKGAHGDGARRGGRLLLRRGGRLGRRLLAAHQRLEPARHHRDRAARPHVLPHAPASLRMRLLASQCAGPTATLRDGGATLAKNRCTGILQAVCMSSGIPGSRALTTSHRSAVCRMAIHHFHPQQAALPSCTKQNQSPSMPSSAWLHDAPQPGQP